MRVHHLNCGTLCPFGARLLNGEGGWFSPGKLVCHCLLIESDSGLVLVDTGMGLIDMPPGHVMGRPWEAFNRPRMDPAETAVRQLESLGFKSSDVRDIVFTHLDLDHAGGLPDFPRARVHVFDVEHQAAMERKGFKEKPRYLTAHWAHKPDWALHSPGGDQWMGFESVQALDGDAGPEVLLVPLTGHTRGHCAVAVRSDDGWLLHCGDAYFDRGEVDIDNPHCPAGINLFQVVAGMDDKPRAENQRRLRELKRDHGGEVTLFCAHDYHELDAFGEAVSSR